MTTAATAKLQSHCEARGSEACSGLPQASQLSGNCTTCWKIEGKCQGHASGPSFLTPSFLHASSKWCHFSQTSPCSAAFLISSVHALGPLSNSLYTSLPPRNPQLAYWCSLTPAEPGPCQVLSNSGKVRQCQRSLGAFKASWTWKPP